MSTLLESDEDYELVALDVEDNPALSDGSENASDEEEDDEEDTTLRKHPGSEKWIQAVSIAADESASANIGFTYIVMSLMTSKLADGMLTGYILPTTDLYFLIFGYALVIAIFFKLLGYTVIGILFKNDRSRVSTWFHSVVLILNFLFFVAFWIAYSVIVIMFSVLFQVTAASATAAGLMVAYTSIAILFLLGHTSLGLISHRTVIVTDAKGRDRSHTSSTTSGLTDSKTKKE
jgi:hypothetical protein